MVHAEKEERRRDGEEEMKKKRWRRRDEEGREGEEWVLFLGSGDSAVIVLLWRGHGGGVQRHLLGLGLLQVLDVRVPARCAHVCEIITIVMCMLRAWCRELCRVCSLAGRTLAYQTEATVATRRPTNRRKEICTSPKMNRPMPVVKMFLIWPVTLVVSGELMIEHRKMK
jgi:hypothetical protein